MSGPVSVEAGGNSGEGWRAYGAGGSLQSVGCFLGQLGNGSLAGGCSSLDGFAVSEACVWRSL